MVRRVSRSKFSCARYASDESNSELSESTRLTQNEDSSDCWIGEAQRVEMRERESCDEMRKRELR